MHYVNLCCHEIYYRYNSTTPEISEIECLSILLDPDMTRLRNPNWFELRNYVNFANSQLSKLEKLSLVDHIQNFRPFCLKLCLMMAESFGLPSLDVVIDDSSEENTGQNIDIVQLERLQIRDDRRWESLVRPYFIMNADGESLTLIGSYIDRFVSIIKHLIVIIKIILKKIFIFNLDLQKK